MVRTVLVHEFGTSPPKGVRARPVGHEDFVVLDDLSRHLARETNLKQELKETTLLFLAAQQRGK